MPFQEFRYLADAEPGLNALFTRGVSYESLIQKIRSVQAEWQPEDDDDSQYVVPFHGFYLVFTVSVDSRSTLVLAAVEPQPRT